MSCPTEVNLCMRRGDDWSRRANITISGVAVDISNWTVYFTLKNNVDDADEDAVYQQIIGPGSHAYGTSGGTILNIPHESSVDFIIKDVFYDVQAKSDSNIVSTPVTGVFTIGPDITRTD